MESKYAEVLGSVWYGGPTWREMSTGLRLEVLIFAAGLMGAIKVTRER